MKKSFFSALFAIVLILALTFTGCKNPVTTPEIVPDEEIITLGSWPQTIKAASVTITSETKVAGAFTYFKGSDGEWYVRCQENAYESGYKYSNGTEAAQGKTSYQYFKVEPIKWRVITDNYNGKKLLVADKILTNCAFFDDWASGRTDGDKEIYANNYKESRVRAFLNGLSYETGADYNNQISNEFLNKGFLQTAFTAEERIKIAYTKVDNSLSSTNPDDLKYKFDFDLSRFICEDTTDQIFLLSEQEVTKKEYGFDPNPDASLIDGVSKKSSRVRQTTDFAKANGAFQNTEKGFGGCWWLRSPAVTYSGILTVDFVSQNVSNTGAANSAFWTYDSASGVVPALCIYDETIYPPQGASRNYVVRNDWAPDVKAAINDFIAIYGKNSPNYNPNSYVVSDFDNTCSIFDVEEQLAAYQLQVMAFEIKPEELADILKTDIGTLTDPREGYAKDGASHSYQDWIDDITAAYSYLYTTYGPFTAAGLEADKQATIQADPQWLEFAAKMRAMYDLIFDNESAAVAYPWVLYWFTGMTETEVYNLAKASHEKYKAVETSEVTWTSPADISSKVGQVDYKWTSGTQVSQNINEMFGAFLDNGIKVWICSASATDPIRAAIDVWGLHDKITGVIAMANVLNDGKYVNQYDGGCAWFANADGTWTKGNVATKAQTQGYGKVSAINSVLADIYDCAPLAGFMDSTGDFEFCTLYKNLKLVICFNRASRKVTDGGGLIGEIAIYERDTLGYDLAKANKAGDTLYVLQGRDENGFRTLRNSNSTLRYGKTEEKLFRDDNNQAQLQYMIEHKMTVKEALKKFAKKN